VTKSLFFVTDPGSTHLGNWEYIQDLIGVSYHSGAQAIKFQLFTDPAVIARGNIPLSFDYYVKAKEYVKKELQNFEIFASVFDEESFEFLLSQKPRFIKLAYSKRNERDWIERALSAGIKPIVSCELLEINKLPKEAFTLFCIPEYPVKYKVEFEGFFDEGRFDGFSDHTLGFKQSLRAIDAGARILEKHITLNHPGCPVPDHAFALKPNQMKDFQRHLNMMRPSHVKHIDLLSV
jgi:N,N'-diacetyllegionaminate synthase